MSWTAISERRMTKPERPATIAIFRRGKHKDVLPAVAITLTRTLATRIDWQHGAPVALLVGKDQDAGRLRLLRGGEPAVAKVRRFKRGTLFFDLGHLPEIGGEDGQTARVVASIVDDDTVEIMLPDWAHASRSGVEASADDDDDAGEGNDTPPSAPRRRAAAVPATTLPVKANSEQGATTRHGVTISITPDSETIGFAGREMDLTAHQASLALVLLRAAPNFVGHFFARDKVLGANAPRASERFATIVTDLQRAAAAVGLKLVSERGHGLRLAGTDADE